MPAKWPILSVGLSLVLMMGGAGPAWAQDSGLIDFRVGDANNQVGSGGRNYSVESSFQPNFANLYITGNVTGGKSFQAFSPIQNPNSLRVGVGSGGLSAFRRDSVSVEDALQGRTAATAPFFAREQTVTNIGTLSAGLGPLDPSRPYDVYRVPSLDGSLSLPSGRAASLDPAFDAQLGALSSVPYGRSSFDDVLRRYERSPIRPVLQFDLPLPTDAEQPPFTRSEFEAAPTNLFEQPLAAENVDLLTRSNLLSPTLQSEIERQVRSQLEGQQPPSAVDEQTGFPEFEAPQPGRPEGVPEDTQEPLVPRLPGLTPVEEEPAPTAEPSYQPSGYDLYADLLGAYQAINELEEEGLEVNQILYSDLRLLEEYSDVAAEIRRRVATAPDALAGEGDTELQRILFDGDQMLRQGQYYQAANAYAKAAVLEPRNPLTLLGQGHALLAAGEYYSAVLRISRAVEMFPAIGMFQFDLSRLITDSELLERRRADLETRLAQSEDYQFRFLLGYIEYYTGLQKYGRANLTLAAEAAPPDSGIALFPQYVLEQKPETPGLQQP